jgi:hypothetical protein
MQQGWGLRPGRIALPKAVRVRGMTAARLEKVGGPTLGVVEPGQASPATKMLMHGPCQTRPKAAERSLWPQSR